MILESYTLFTHIPLYRKSDGVFFTDPLWEKDLSAHLKYISRFAICCPILEYADSNTHLVQVPDLTPDKVFELPYDKGWFSVFWNIIPKFLNITRAIRKSDIVHSGGAGWPFPLSYYILFVSAFLTFKWIIVIESSFWMKPETGRISIRKWLSHHLNLTLLKRCVRSADARIFTQDWYRKTFLGSYDATLVAPAIWVDEAQIRSEADLIASFENNPNQEVRILFPSRLTEDKGVGTVLKALEIIETRGEISDGPRVDIMGQGPLADTCKVFAAKRSERVVRFLEPISYDAFSLLLRSYDAVIVANRYQEQPRIVYDAFGQGVTCIATRTNGIRNIIEDKENGLLFNIDDAEGLADLLSGAGRSRMLLHQLSLSALRGASERTHSRMHENRETFLKKTLNLRQG